MHFLKLSDPHTHFLPSSSQPPDGWLEEFERWLKTKKIYLFNLGCSLGDAAEEHLSSSPHPSHREDPRLKTKISSFKNKKAEKKRTHFFALLCLPFFAHHFLCFFKHSTFFFFLPPSPWILKNYTKIVLETISNEIGSIYFFKILTIEYVS